jgi:hypothetical protein
MERLQAQPRKVFVAHSRPGIRVRTRDPSAHEGAPLVIEYGADRIRNLVIAGDSVVAI